MKKQLIATLTNIVAALVSVFLIWLILHDLTIAFFAGVLDFVICQLISLFAKGKKDSRHPRHTEIQNTITTAPKNCCQNVSQQEPKSDAQLHEQNRNVSENDFPVKNFEAQHSESSNEKEPAEEMNPLENIVKMVMDAYSETSKADIGLPLEATSAQLMVAGLLKKPPTPLNIDTICYSVYLQNQGAKDDKEAQWENLLSIASMLSKVSNKPYSHHTSIVKFLNQNKFDNVGELFGEEDSPTNYANEVVGWVSQAIQHDHTTVQDLYKTFFPGFKLQDSQSYTVPSLCIQIANEHEAQFFTDKNYKLLIKQIILNCGEMTALPQNSFVDVIKSLKDFYRKENASFWGDISKNNEPSVIEKNNPFVIEDEGGFSVSLIANCHTCYSSAENPLEAWVKDGNNPYVRDKAGYTLLIALANSQYNEEKRCKEALFLINCGVDINACSKKSHSSALIVASCNSERFPNFVSLLLSRGANVDEKNVNGETALMLVSKYEAPDRRGSRTFYDGETKDGYSWSSIPQEVHDDLRILVIKELLRYKADVYAFDNSHHNALYHALDGSLDVIKILCNAMGNRAWDCEDVKDLFFRIGHVEESKLDFFLSLGADVNAKDDDGMTPLMHYMGGCDISDSIVVAFLLKHGADTTITDNRGRTALAILVGPQNHFLWYSCSIESLRALLNSGVKIDDARSALDVLKNYNEKDANAVPPEMIQRLTIYIKNNKSQKWLLKSVNDDEAFNLF